MARPIVVENGRLDIRLSKENKDLIEHAAMLRRMSLSQFVIESMLRDADAIIKQYERSLVQEPELDVTSERYSEHRND